MLILRASGDPPERRAARRDLERLPVPADALVYTPDEWRRLPETSPRLQRVLSDETVRVWGKPPQPAALRPGPATPAP